MFFSWCVVGAMGAGFVLARRFLLRADAPMEIVARLFLFWLVAWFWLARRISTLPCPRCGRPALAHPFFLVSRARCRHCGFSYAA